MCIFIKSLGLLAPTTHTLVQSLEKIKVCTFPDQRLVELSCVKIAQKLG